MTTEEKEDYLREYGASDFNIYEDLWLAGSGFYDVWINDTGRLYLTMVHDVRRHGEEPIMMVRIK